MVKPWNAKQYSNFYLHDEFAFFQNHHEVLAVYMLGYGGAKLGDSPVVPVKCGFSYLYLGDLEVRYTSSYASGLLVLEDWIWLFVSSEDLGLVAWHLPTLLRIPSIFHLLKSGRAFTLLWHLIISKISHLSVLSAYTWHSLIHPHLHHAHTVVFVNVIKFVHLSCVFSNNVFDLSK